MNSIFSALDGGTVSVLLIVFASLAVATLIPAVNKFFPWPVEIVIWTGMVAASALRVNGIDDPKVREATLSAAWAGTQLLYTQLSLLGDGVQTWVVASRFGIATVAVMVTGVDLLALTLIRSHRRASRALPQAHLGEWFVLPRQSAELAPDAVAELDRRLAASVRKALRSASHSPAVETVLVRPFAHIAARALGPGPARLRMVKLALGFEPRHQPGLSTRRASVASSAVDGRAGHRLRSRLSGRRNKVKSGGARRQADRLAS